MHDIRFIREHPDAFDRGLARRGLAPQAAALIALDEARRGAIATLETAAARRNAASKEIGEAKKSKDDAKADSLLAEVAALKAALPAMEAQEKAASEQLNAALAALPNLPLDEVPDGADADGNVEHHRFGARPDFRFAPRQHFDLGEAFGQMDFEAAARLSGARFVVLKKDLARLERALGQFMLDVHTSAPHNYVEVSPPLMVREPVMFGTAQLPKFRTDQFLATWEVDGPPEAPSNSRWMVETMAADGADRGPPPGAPAQAGGAEGFAAKALSAEGLGAKGLGAKGLSAKGLTAKGLGEILWLIPTAEVPLTNLVRESIVEEAALPMRLTALTPCFRAEAGAAGKDTRGMIRQHQFTKVELVSITAPEQSKQEHERMLACAEEVLRRLDLHYRVVTLCSGDMGFASQKTYDIEVWLPGQNAFREISSCSSCGDFQARRMNARYRVKAGRQVRHVHTLNGSGVAVGRALIAVMETYQQEDGSIAVPQALQGYMGGMKTIAKS